MAAGCRDETGNDSDQVVVHVAGVSQCRGRRGHDRRYLYISFPSHNTSGWRCAYQLIGLYETWILDM